MCSDVATIEVGTRHLGKRLFHYRAGTSDEPVQQIFVQRDYDISRLSRAPDIVAFYQQVVAQGRVPLIIDAGANIGASTLYLADTWPDARVIAIEPDTGNMDLLRGNTDGLSNVSCIHAALAAHTGEMLLIDPGVGHWGFRAFQPNEVSAEATVREHVPALGMDDLLRQFSHRYAPFLCKLDIEGGEKDLFADATGWIDRFPLLVIELHDWFFPRQAASHNFLHEMSVRDRDFVSRGENIFSISNRFPEVIACGSGTTDDHRQSIMHSSHHQVIAAIGPNDA
jgi:FkbM family methyltransferase